MKNNSLKVVQNFLEYLTERNLENLTNLFFENENAVITGEFSTKMLATNKIVDSMFCIQMQIKNNKILKYRLLEDSLAVSKSLTI